MRTNLTLVVVATFLAACSTSSTTTDTGTDPGILDVGPDVPVLDVPTPDVIEDMFHSPI